MVFYKLCFLYKARFLLIFSPLPIKSDTNMSRWGLRLRVFLAKAVIFQIVMYKNSPKPIVSFKTIMKSIPNLFSSPKKYSII